MGNCCSNNKVSPDTQNRAIIKNRGIIKNKDIIKNTTQHSNSNAALNITSQTHTLILNKISQPRI
jgi:hypothetical protein